MKTKQMLTIGSGKSLPITACQACANKKLSSVIFLGFLPPVNKLRKIGDVPNEEPSYPAELMYCAKCHMAQLGLIVDPSILFPPEYPYTSGTTKVLRDNFADLSDESIRILDLKKEDLVVDIGSNDGTLLQNFKNKTKVLGITPEDVGKVAIKNGIPTIIDYFNRASVQKVKSKHGKAKLITAANVFAHMEDIDGVIENIKSLLTKDGVFISESHYLLPLIKYLQYDTIYHEHMRYYSLLSLKNLLNKHGLEVFHVKEIPSHGGSIRVYSAKKGLYKTDKSISRQLSKEKPYVTSMKPLKKFAAEVTLSKLALSKLLYELKNKKKTIYGISAPSRASTLINYTGLDAEIITAVVEVADSYKIGNYIPGTLIPILDEKNLYKSQPDYALLLSWHIAKELMPKLKKNGFGGDFIIPLPSPKIFKNREV